MFCKETKIDGDFDTKIVLGSGHVLAFQVLWRRHTQAQESYKSTVEQGHLFGRGILVLLLEIWRRVWPARSEPGSRHFLAFQVLQHRQTKAGIKKAIKQRLDTFLGAEFASFGFLFESN